MSNTFGLRIPFSQEKKLINDKSIIAHEDSNSFCVWMNDRSYIFIEELSFLTVQEDSFDIIKYPHSSVLCAVSWWPCFHEKDHLV